MASGTFKPRAIETDTLAVAGATPVGRQAAITAPTGGATIDTQARTAINDIITALETFGLVIPN